MGGDGAAGAGDIDVLEVAALFENGANAFDNGIINAGMGDEYTLGHDVAVHIKLVVDILLDTGGELSAELLGNAH